MRLVVFFQGESSNVDYGHWFGRGESEFLNYERKTSEITDPDFRSDRVFR